MAESRDRLSRPIDYANLFVQRRSGPLGILITEPESGSDLWRTPMGRHTAVPEMGATPGRPAMGLGGSTRGRGLLRGSFGTPRTAGNGRGRRFYGSVIANRENTLAGSARRGRGGHSVSGLPSWYPRTPLRDITAIVRAIERRRARLGETEGQQIESLIPHDQGTTLDTTLPLPSALPEHNISMISQTPELKITSRPLLTEKIRKILPEMIDKNNAEESEFLTPQKKLLNSIDMVEKFVREELEKLRKTPSAKRAEREKKVRTLMSMR